MFQDNFHPDNSDLDPGAHIIEVVQKFISGIHESSASMSDVINSMIEELEGAEVQDMM